MHRTKTSCTGNLSRHFRREVRRLVADSSVVHPAESLAY